MTPAGEAVGAGEWLAGLPSEVRQWDSPLERAALSAIYAAVPAHAVAAGHQAALRALLPGLGTDGVVAFCASEEGGAHPRAIHTRLVARSSGDYRLQGSKRWATLAPSAATLLVVASTGHEGDRNLLRVAQVPAARPGIRIEPMPPAGFLPELAHAVVTLDDVVVEPSELLPGDGYLDAVKPFRTIEDLHVAAALVAFTLGVGARCGWPQSALERQLALLAAARDLAAAPHDAAGTHLALAGWLSQVQEARREEAALWGRADPWLAAAWQRDTAREVAAAAQERRRERAWERLRG
ncbi:MAG TPA: acyl-CoA dehydrogenase family protein [Thermoanaerobaculia bacterium]|nr:acyl-CoA dehydrogenase family protein [Thermoanaerobaculia bacterium]